MNAQVLDGAKLKAQRALEQIEEIRVAIEKFNQDAKYEIFCEKSENSTICRAKLITPLPTTLNVRIGEVLFNLRSALDLLAWALLSLIPPDQPKPNPRNVYFPVADSKDIYKGSEEKRKFFPPGALKLFDELKPYYPEEGYMSGKQVDGNEVLWDLHRIHKDDKHRTLLMVVYRPTGIDISDLAFNVPIEVGYAPDFENVETGVELFRTPETIEPLPASAVKIKAFVSFEEIPTLSVVSVMTSMALHTQEILTRFEKELFAKK